MKAGFSKRCVNPRVGSAMEGLGQPSGCVAIHDDLFVRTLFVEHGGEEALIIGCDLLFFERRNIDRFKGAIGRRLDLEPNRILFNTSHNHAGPRLTEWAYSGAPEPGYLDLVEAGLVGAAAEAKASRTEVTVWGGMTETDLPVSRRKPNAQGKAEWKPYHAGPTCKALPVTVLKDARGKVVSVLFSVSCHPSMWYALEISAEYPGVAQRRINEHFKTDGALFLQGCGGDAKPKYVADGEQRWVPNKEWDKVELAGREVADAVIRCAESDLSAFSPEIRNRYVEMRWPLAPAPARRELETVRDAKDSPPVRVSWAKDMLDKLDRLGALPVEAPVGLHALQLAKGLRLIGLEGESVAELGNLILKLYSRGVTFPLGYTDGTQLYLPVSRMHDEGGYEAVSFYEYHWPAALQPVEEALLEKALMSLQKAGIEA